MNLRPSVSFIVPAFNEANSIGRVLASLHEVASAELERFEILLVDDGSIDATAAVAAEFFQEHPDAGRLISNQRNRGYGFSLKHGASMAQMDTLFFFDADGQHRADQIGTLVDAWTDQSHLLIGQRNSSKSSPIWRRPGKTIIRWAAQVITGSSFPDLFSGFRMWSRSLFLEMMGIFPNGFSISTTSTIAAEYMGIPPTWVEIEVDKRVGRSTATAVDGLRIALLLVRIIVLFAPLRFFFPLSLVVGSVGVIFTASSYATEGVASVRGLIALLIALTIALQGLLVDQIAALRRGERIKQTYDRTSVVR